MLRGLEALHPPIGASEFNPSFQQFGVSDTPSQGPCRSPERLPGAQERLSEVGSALLFVPNGPGKEGGFSEALRGPISRRAPERVPTLRLPPSGRR